MWFKLTEADSPWEILKLRMRCVNIWLLISQTVSSWTGWRSELRLISLGDQMSDWHKKHTKWWNSACLDVCLPSSLLDKHKSNFYFTHVILAPVRHVWHRRVGWLALLRRLTFMLTLVGFYHTHAQRQRRSRPWSQQRSAGVVGDQKVTGFKNKGRAKREERKRKTKGSESENLFSRNKY